MDVKDYLQAHGIAFSSFTHPPVYTCEEANTYNQDIRGVHCKNLLLKDRKSRAFFLVILPADQQASMDSLGDTLKTKLKFANEQDLQDKLGVDAGSVTPFALLNDTEHKVILVIDPQVWNADYVSFHPNVNTETLELQGRAFQQYVKSLENTLITL